MSKAQDRLKALQQRAGSYATRPEATPPAPTPPEVPTGDALADARAYFGVEPLDRIAGDRSIQALPLARIAPNLRPGEQQPRLLPLPAELLVDGQPVPAYADLVVELTELGRSLQNRQLQPIIVYPGTNDAFPAATHLILVGHRRWTAAMLVGMETINAIVVDPPTAAERVGAQYAENEDRADFSDMERAWSLVQMKQALDDAPWEAVEERFRLSRSRRQDLLRLLALSEAQQREAARMRLRETQLRPLHTALRSGELTQAHADIVLAKIAQPAGDGETVIAVDGPTIARLVAQTKRQVEKGGERTPPSSPQWLTALNDQLGRTEQSLKRAEKRVGELGDTDTATLVSRLLTVSMRMAELAESLTRQEEMAENAEHHDTA